MHCSNGKMVLLKLILEIIISEEQRECWSDDPAWDLTIKMWIIIDRWSRTWSPQLFSTLSIFIKRYEYKYSKTSPNFNILCQPTVKYSTTYQRWTKKPTLQLPVFFFFPHSLSAHSSLSMEIIILLTIFLLFIPLTNCLQFQKHSSCSALLLNLTTTGWNLRLLFVTYSTPMADLDHSSDESSVDSRGTHLKLEVL